MTREEMERAYSGPNDGQYVRALRDFRSAWNAAHDPHTALAAANEHLDDPIRAFDLVWRTLGENR